MIALHWIPQVGQYFGLITGLQNVTNKTEQLSALLNAGQAVILTGGMASVMFAAVLVGRCVKEGVKTSETPKRDCDWNPPGLTRLNALMPDEYMGVEWVSLHLNFNQTPPNNNNIQIIISI